MSKDNATDQHDTLGDWSRCNARLPENGAVVETKIDDEHGVRNVAKLRRSGRFWFLADGSIYVYYEPTHWREVS